ncbi:MAG: hypothetical protein IKU86_07290 [Thermoguttaceae bacterium]|nr:hypothetical protein [Thermoguttaceae bacterium]
MPDAVSPRFQVPTSTKRRVFQRLFERAQAFAAAVSNANEQANALVKSLEILRLERELYATKTLDAPSLADWRLCVKTTLDAAKEAISAVESRGERSYLRRIALDAALALNAFDATFFNEKAADDFLAEIDDAEERQNALAAYSSRLAERIFRFKQSDGSERVKAFALVDEIEDLRSFERAASTVAAAVLFDATSRNTTRESDLSLNATLDLTPFGDDVAAVWEQFESVGGFLELCERAANEFLNFNDATPPTRAEIELRRAFNAETRRRLETILTALDSGFDADGNSLDENDREEMQNVVAEAVASSPFVLQDGDFFRAFLDRSCNLAAFFPVFERLSEAEKASRSDANCRLRSFYRLSSEDCAQEKERWLDAARRVANDAESTNAEFRVKIDRLTTFAELEFQFGDKAKGKETVRDLLSSLPRLDSPFERARYYRRLVAIHLKAAYPKAAQKLAQLWLAELAAIEPEDLRDAALVDAFDLYAKVVKSDATALTEFVATTSASLARVELQTRRNLDLLFSQEVGADATELASRLASLADSTLQQFEALDETPPDEAVFALVNIADAFARRFNALGKPL